jgi:acyl carrier protein
MGMDTVELIMRAEEVFAIDLPDDECGLVETVGDFYRLVLKHLNLTQDAQTPLAKLQGRSRLEDQFPGLQLWTPADVWATLVAIIEDQLQVDIEEITEHATFQEDLGCD